MKQPEVQAAAGHNGASHARPGRKPMKVLSTSLGMALAANLLAVPAVSAEGADSASKPQPKLVEWSSDAVKSYYDPSIDWNFVLPGEKKQDGAASSVPPPATGDAAGAGGAGGAASAGGHNVTSPVVVHSGGGFGWDDLLMYHLLFNNGGVFSTSSWSQSHNTVYANNRQPYQARSYTPETFQNKPVAGSAVRSPQTAASSGSFSTSKSSPSKSSTSSSSISSSGAAAPSTSSSSGSFSSLSSKSSSASSGSIGSHSSGFSSSSGG